MFDLVSDTHVAERDVPLVSLDAGAARLESARAQGPAVIVAGLEQLAGMLARAAEHRRVCPDWPARGSSWTGYLPGPELARVATERLADPDLTQAERLDCIDALTRSVNAISGTLTATIADFVDSECREHPDGVATGLKSAQAELELLLKLSPTGARNLVGRTQALAGLPTTLAALKAGAISQTGANIVADETALLEPAHRRTVEDVLFPAAGAHTDAKLKREVRTAIAGIDPELVRARHAAEKRRRDVMLSPCAFGMAKLTAYLPAPDALGIAGIVRAHAKTLTGDGRNWGERKADAFKEFFLGSRTKPKPRVSVQVRVVVPAGTVLGLGDEPGYLAGYGAIPADLARNLAADGTWRRLLTDPADGTVLDYGSTRYRPTRPLVERIRARDLECDSPGCLMAAHDSDLDHQIPWRADGTGGSTGETNLRARCQHHHDVKGLPGWKVRTHRDGTTRWTTPHGRTYTSTPPRFPPERR